LAWPVFSVEGADPLHGTVEHLVPVCPRWRRPLTPQQVALPTPEDPVERALRLLDVYAATRDQERYARELAKTYNRRRQSAYQTYLKSYDALQQHPSFTDDVRRLFDQKLEEINKKA
jgi:hypothetical protein